MRKFNCIAVLSCFLLIFWRCGTGNEIIDPEGLPDPEKPRFELAVKLDNRKFEHFQHISPAGQVTELKETEVEKYFGKDIAYALPLEIKATKDSTFLLKDGGITEAYKSKWEGGKLYFSMAADDQWELLGERGKDTEFKTSLNFYILRNEQPSISNFAKGHVYNLERYKSLRTSASMEVFWLTYGLLYK
ncbi:hypothetical protein ACS126_08140 [Sphingobacterium lactis]|uniref:hypothetical protein n=1 Tax=Sphingobacterium lactis TaxID=797291 RepID=UPI003EC92690